MTRNTYIATSTNIKWLDTHTLKKLKEKIIK